MTLDTHHHLLETPSQIEVGMRGGLDAPCQAKTGIATDCNLLHLTYIRPKSNLCLLTTCMETWLSCVPWDDPWLCMELRLHVHSIRRNRANFTCTCSRKREMGCMCMLAIKEAHWYATEKHARVHHPPLPSKSITSQSVDNVENEHPDQKYENY